MRIVECGKGKGRNGPSDLDPHLSGLFRTLARGIGEAEQYALVELAAVNAVTSEYRSRGWRVMSKESEKVGYDLLCRRGSAVHHVEVKGIRGAICSFMITAKKTKAELDSAAIWSREPALSLPAWPSEFVATGSPSQFRF